MVKRYFDKHDKLHRKKYADFLRTIINNSDSYKRTESEESYVIAVDSSWGTGKTYFVDMFENYLLGDDDKEEQNGNNEFVVIRFDAWKNDFWDNAFEPFVINVLENDMFFLENDHENAKNMLKELLKSTIAIARGIAKKQLEKQVDPDSLDEAIKEFSGSAKDFMFGQIKIFEDYQNFKENIEKFRSILSSIVNPERKVVIIIDELDRCKPTFSIQLLEIVKHLFNIKGITFIFMLDIEQLSYSLKTVYGQDMDSTSYLCRFFDYITRMPKPDIQTYVKESLVEVKLFEGVTDEEKKDLEDFFVEVCKYFNLSLRDIDTIICSYRIMLDCFLREYIYIEAYMQYLFYLTLKYKDVAEFNNVFKKGRIADRVGKNGHFDFPQMRDSLNNITTIICKMDYIIYNRYYYKEGLRSHGDEILIINKLEEDKIWLKTKQGRKLNLNVDLDEDIRFNYLLFAPDIRKWEEIKELSYGEYVHQQLEMFNFVARNTDQSSRN